jgi:hypothetical protein
MDRVATNWKTRRELVLARACHRCEKCGAPQYAVGQWRDERFLLARAEPQQQFALVHSTARALADRLNGEEKPEQPYIVIVLTVVAGDGGGSDRAMCQRCDAAQGTMQTKEVRRQAQAKADLFESEESPCSQ